MDFMGIWNYLVKSNAFNFALMILFFVLIDRKVHFGALIEGAKNKVIESIDKSKEEKNHAQKELKSAKGEVARVEEDVKEALKNAKSQAKMLVQQITERAENKVKAIETGAQKALESEEKKLSSGLTAKTAKDSVELARTKILKMLEENPKLHEQFIEESIEQI